MNLTGFAEAFDDMGSRGTPLEIPMADVREDPDQPRKQFDPVALQELAGSIAARGVKTPISVHDDPARPGKYIVNHGARRLRASRMCGKPTIPAFVDEVYDAYDQVIENLQRENLTPMELAMFIQKRIEAGDKKGEIAKQLGKAPSVIAYHLALIDAPPVIEEVYAAGVTSPKTLYELRALHKKEPEQVEALVASGAGITRKSIAEIAGKFSHDKKAKTGTQTETRKNLVMTKKIDAAPIPFQDVQNLVMTKFQMPASMSYILRRASESGQISVDALINQALQEFFRK